MSPYTVGNLASLVEKVVALARTKNIPDVESLRSFNRGKLERWYIAQHIGSGLTVDDIVSVEQDDDEVDTRPHFVAGTYCCLIVHATSLRSCSNAARQQQHDVHNNNFYCSLVHCLKHCVMLLNPCSLSVTTVDHAERAVVLSMRGTLSLADSMLDLLADTVPYAGGVAHKGVARYACVYALYLALFLCVHAYV
jgi:hypothetical protein